MTLPPLPDPATLPAVILVRPQLGENIGAAARAMLNFGLTDLRLVAPRDGWPNPAAIATASGAAGAVLDRARVFPTLDAALAGTTRAYATTARGRELARPVMTPADAMAEARALPGAGGRAALVFGPERAGMDNAEIARASVIVTVPVNPAFASLNLAQAVLLLAYEHSRGGLPDQPAPRGRAGAGEGPADRAAIGRLADAWEDGLDRAGFFFPPDKAASMKTALRAFWGRMPLAEGDVRVLHGALKQLLRGR